MEKREIQSVIKLDAHERFFYSIKRICDFEAIWTLGNEDGLVTYTSNDGDILFPLWPKKEYAELCRLGIFNDAYSEEIKLIDFVEDYLPIFRENGYRLVIFPTPSDRGAAVDIEYFLRMLHDENLNY